MNWIAGIQRAIDYVEDNLTDEIDFKDVAKRAYSSTFHFQKVFACICDYSLGEYIRLRRLSQSAKDLAEGQKVLDVALKYGYDTPESFSRAFTRFHGVTPMQAKNGAATKFFSRLNVTLSLQGGNMMDYRIEKLDSFKVVCKRQRFVAEKELTFEKIPAFWQQCSEDGTMNSLITNIPSNPRLKGLIGISFTSQFEGNRFPYGIGVEYDGIEVDDRFEVIEIPAQTYAVFPVKGKLPDSFIKTYKKICTEFFPQSGYDYGKSIEMEVYPSNDTQSSDYYFELWIAVK